MLECAVPDESFSRACELADAGEHAAATRLLLRETRGADAAQRGPALAVLGALLLSRGRAAAARKAYLLSRACPCPDRGALWRRYALALALRDYPGAFADGRAILACGRPDLLDGLLDLYVLRFRHRGHVRPGTKRSGPWLRSHLRALRPGHGLGEDDPWRIAYRGHLLRIAGRSAEARREFSRLERLAKGRDRFLLWIPGRAALLSGRPGPAASLLRSAAAAFPAAWRLKCWLGEALLCAGRPRRAWTEFEAARTGAGDFSRSSALSWQAEARLWIGDYGGCLDLLAHAQEAPTAIGWAGAALLKLGRRQEALGALEQACRRHPYDGEAAVWHAEALWRDGQTRAALREARRAFRANRNPWALVLQALARQTPGARGARAVLGRLRRDFPAWWSSWGWRVESADRPLERMLELALGNRRPEPYPALATRAARARGGLNVRRR